MKRKILISLLALSLTAQPVSALLPMGSVYAAETGTSGKKLNSLSNTQCVIYEPNFDKDKFQSLTPGVSVVKDPYVKSESRYDAYVFVRVEIPTVRFTVKDADDNTTTVVGDVVKPSYEASNGSTKEGFNTESWQVVKEQPSSITGTRSRNTILVMLPVIQQDIALVITKVKPMVSIR